MSEQPLFSDNWFRVKRLKPRLRPHVRLHRQVIRGAVWYVLEDASNARFHRFDAVAHRVIGLMDGQRTVQKLWEDVNTLKSCFIAAGSAPGRCAGTGLPRPCPCAFRFSTRIASSRARSRCCGPCTPGLSCCCGA